MSADNGVYILKTTRKEHGGYEYRVAHCSAIDNIEYLSENDKYPHQTKQFNDFWILRLFGKSPIFYSEEEARDYARKIENELYICEYGICEIDYPLDFPTPLSREEVLKLAKNVLLYQKSNHTVRDGRTELKFRKNSEIEMLLDVLETI